jgi:hypothetical protein
MTEKERERQRRREFRERRGWRWPAMCFSDVDPARLHPLDDAPFRRLPEPTRRNTVLDHYYGNSTLID